jgi:hypothetical protein
MTIGRHSKPTTLGYFVKRLTGSGYRVEKVFTDYALTDPRAWTIIIDPGCASVICTCYINKNGIGDNFFEFYDGGQFLPNMKIKTQSVEVLIEYLVKYGINNKMSDTERKSFETQHNDDIKNDNTPKL